MELTTERSGPQSPKLKAFLLCIAFSTFVTCALLAPASCRAESEDRKSFGREVFDIKVRMTSISEARLAHRGLVGSSPPRCINKCETCTPCEAVLVPINPGTPTVEEYYPEAWRCTCGGRLFMP